MEPMHISIVSVVVTDDTVRVRARAVAAPARIYLAVMFDAEGSRAELWERARREVCRYLDPA